MCKVLNKRVTGVPAGAVYIGRGSKWGNPFRIDSDSDRCAIIAKHERWLADQHHLLRTLDELRASLRSIKSLSTTIDEKPTSLLFGKDSSGNPTPRAPRGKR